MRKSIMFTFILLFVVTLLGCSSNLDFEEITENNDNSNIQPLAAGETPDRKIIYTVNATFDVTNIEESVDSLKDLLETDEWFDSENIGSSSASFNARIRTDRLD